MKHYIDNLIPRLKSFSKNLDRKEIFIDTPWITIDENNNFQKYIFKRNGELIMSFNGEVKIGSWEYLPSAKSLLIDRLKDKILLNQQFIHPALMALQLDGSVGNNFILANETIIPDYNVEDFLKKLYYENYNIKTVKLKDGRLLEIDNNAERIRHVTLDQAQIEDCLLESEDNRKFLIVESKIDRILFDTKYNTSEGNLIVEQSEFGISIGDRVFLDEMPAPDGKYGLGFFDNLYVLNGRIVEKKSYKQVYK